MKWGRQRYFKQARERRALYKLRSSWAQACQVPYDLMFSSRPHVSSEDYKKFKKMNKISLKGIWKLTDTFPKKQRKAIRNKFTRLK